MVSLRRTGPLQRKTPLARTSMPRERRKPLRSVSARRRKRDANYEAAQLAVWERAEGRCEYVHKRGGCRCENVMDDTHHIAGRVGPHPHRLTNLIGLCRFHHDYVHAHPEWAREAGYMRSRLGGAA